MLDRCLEMKHLQSYSILRIVTTVESKVAERMRSGSSFYALKTDLSNYRMWCGTASIFLKLKVLGVFFIADHKDSERFLNPWIVAFNVAKR